jgi:translocator protein
MVWVDDPIGWGAIVTVCAIVGAFAVDREYYTKKLKKPSWAPQPWVFGAVWPPLYISQALATYFVIREHHDWTPGTWVYLAFLVVSTLWNWVFFYFREHGLAKLFILASLGCIIATTILYWIEGPWYCGLLTMFTAIWISFATILSFSIKERK